MPAVPAGIGIFSELARAWRLVLDRRTSISARLEEFPKQIEARAAAQS